MNVGEDDMKLIFLAKPSLLEFFMDSGPLAIHRSAHLDISI
jgi:hypothetical protein